MMKTIKSMGLEEFNKSKKQRSPERQLRSDKKQYADEYLG